MRCAALAVLAAVLLAPAIGLAEGGDPCTEGFEKSFSRSGSPIAVYSHAQDSSTARQVQAAAAASAAELSAYFGFPLESSFRVVVAKDRDEFNAVEGRTTQWWVVGDALSKNTIVLLSPRAWDPRSRSYVRVDQLVKHELVHAFAMQLNGKEKPAACRAGLKKTDTEEIYWFDEGLATVLSGQLDSWRSRVKYSFADKPRFSQIFDYGGYATAGTAVAFLLDRFGKEKLFESIRAMPGGYYRLANQAAADRALFAVLGRPEAELEAGWRRFALSRYPPPAK